MKRIPTAIDLAMNMRAHLVQLRTTKPFLVIIYEHRSLLRQLSTIYLQLMPGQLSTIYLGLEKYVYVTVLQVWRKVLPLFFRNVRNET